MNKKTYIIKDPDLIVAVERASKTLTFFPFISMMSPRLFDVGERPMSLIKKNIDLKDGRWGLCYETSQGMHAAMAPGRDLDSMNRAMLTKFLPEANALSAGACEQGVSVELFKWVRNTFSAASTEAIYGPGNPFARRPELAELFWSFDEGLTPLLFGIPTSSARKAHKSRATIIKAMNEYFERGDQEHGMPVVKARYRVNKKYGATFDDMSRFEIGDCIGILINATPTLFWSMLHTYSDPGLLSSLRKEMDAHVAVHSSNRKVSHSINTATLQEDCPLLVSTFREVLRYHTHNSTSRWVSEETLLADRYLLKKDSVVLMPGGVVHMDAALWGEDVNSFNPRRFLKQDAKGGKTKQHPGAYRAWGGGTSLCPGRFFATAEITSVLGMFVARYDLYPADGKRWVIPKTEQNRVASSIHPPSHDVKVKITTREGFEGHKWQYTFSSTHEKGYAKE